MLGLFRNIAGFVASDHPAQIFDLNRQFSVEVVPFRQFAVLAFNHFLEFAFPLFADPFDFEEALGPRTLRRHANVIAHDFVVGLDGHGFGGAFTKRHHVVGGITRHGGRGEGVRFRRWFWLGLRLGFGLTDRFGFGLGRWRP